MRSKVRGFYGTTAIARVQGMPRQRNCSCCPPAQRLATCAPAGINCELCTAASKFLRSWERQTRNDDEHSVLIIIFFFPNRVTALGIHCTVEGETVHASGKRDVYFNVFYSFPYIAPYLSFLDFVLALPVSQKADGCAQNMYVPPKLPLATPMVGSASYHFNIHNLLEGSPNGGSILNFGAAHPDVAKFP